MGQGIPLHHFHLTGPTQLQYESTSNANTPSIHCILLLCVLCIICTHLMSIVHLYILNSGPKYELNYYHFCNINYYYLGIKTKYSRIDLKYFTSGKVVLDPEKGPRGLIENLIRNNKKQRSGTQGKPSGVGSLMHSLHDRGGYYQSYLIFVISFTQAELLILNFYTQQLRKTSENNNK